MTSVVFDINRQLRHACARPGNLLTGVRYNRVVNFLLFSLPLVASTRTSPLLPVVYLCLVFGPHQLSHTWCCSYAHVRESRESPRVVADNNAFFTANGEPELSVHGVRYG